MLALKRSEGVTPAALRAALFEVDVLMQLTASLDEELPSAARRVPSYVAHAVAPSSQGRKQVMLVMSKLEGQPLDQWLYGHDENAFKTLPPSQLLDDPTPGGRVASRCLEGAAATASALLAQVAPVMAVFSGFAYHRDISAHNVLIHGTPLSEEFSILDFGLATGSVHFNQEWRTAHVSGDPRYFMPASWIIITYGTRQLEQLPDRQFRDHYISRLDHFATGVLVLEVFFGLWHGPTTGEHSWLAPARDAWRDYWVRAIGLFQMFHSRGCESTRKYLKTSEALADIVESLSVLCQELVLAADSQPGSAAAPLLRAAAGLLEWRGPLLQWRDVPAVLQVNVSASSGASKESAADKDSLIQTISTETPMTIASTTFGDTSVWSEAGSGFMMDMSPKAEGSFVAEEPEERPRPARAALQQLRSVAKGSADEQHRGPADGAPAATLLGRRLEFRDTKAGERSLADSLISDHSFAKEHPSALPLWHPGFLDMSAPAGTLMLPISDEDAAAVAGQPCKAFADGSAVTAATITRQRSSCLGIVTGGLFRLAAERLQRRSTPSLALAAGLEGAPRLRKPVVGDAAASAPRLVLAGR